MLPGWRAACLAYRAARREGSKDEAAYRAAVEAFSKVRPDVSAEEAAQQATRAISYASVEWGTWLWSGVGRGEE